MKHVVERLPLEAVPLHHSFLLVSASILIVVLSAVLVASLSRSDGHVEVGDLVSILAWCWHFDRTSPVVVEEAEGVRKLLQLNLIHPGLIQRDMEMRGKHTTLVRP